jgi:hypothetical protein
MGGRRSAVKLHLRARGPFERMISFGGLTKQISSVVPPLAL